MKRVVLQAHLRDRDSSQHAYILCLTQGSRLHLVTQIMSQPQKHDSSSSPPHKLVPSGFGVTEKLDVNGLPLRALSLMVKGAGDADFVHTAVR